MESTNVGPKKSILKKTIPVHKSLLISNYSLGPKATYVNNKISSSVNKKRVRTLAPVIKVPQHFRQNKHSKQKETSFSTMFKKTCKNQPIMSLSLKLKKMDTSLPMLRKIKTSRQLSETPPTIETKRHKGPRVSFSPTVQYGGEIPIMQGNSYSRLSSNSILVPPKTCAFEESKLKHSYRSRPKQNTFPLSRFFSPKMAPRQHDEYEQKEQTEESQENKKCNSHPIPQFSEIETLSNKAYLNKKFEGFKQNESVSSELNKEEGKVRPRPNQNTNSSLRVQKGSAQTCLKNDEHKKNTYTPTRLISPKAEATICIKKKRRKPMADNTDLVPQSGEMEQNILSSYTIPKPSAQTPHENGTDKKHNLSLNRLSSPQMPPGIQDDQECLEPMAGDKVVFPLVRKMVKIETPVSSNENTYDVKPETTVPNVPPSRFSSLQMAPRRQDDQECLEPMAEGKVVFPLVRKMVKIETPVSNNENEYDVKPETTALNLSPNRLSSPQVIPMIQHGQEHTEQMENKHVSPTVPQMVQTETLVPSIEDEYDAKPETAIPNLPPNRLSSPQMATKRKHDQEHTEWMENKHVPPLVRQMVKIETPVPIIEYDIKSEISVPNLASNRLSSLQVATERKHDQEHTEPMESKHVPPLVLQTVKVETPLSTNEDQYDIKSETAIPNLPSNRLSSPQVALKRQHDKEHTESMENKHIPPLIRQMAKIETPVLGDEEEYGLKSDTAIPNLPSYRLSSPQVAIKRRHDQEHTEPMENKRVPPLVRQIVKVETPLPNNEDQFDIKSETAIPNLSSNRLSSPQEVPERRNDQEHTEPMENKHVPPLVRQMVKIETPVPTNEDEYDVKPETVITKSVSLNLKKENVSRPIIPRLKQNTYSSFIIKQLYTKMYHENNKHSILHTVIAYFKHRKMQKYTEIKRKRQN